MESQVASELEAAPIDDAQNVFDQPVEAAELEEETGSLEVIAGSSVIAGGVEDSDEARECLKRIKEHYQTIDKFQAEHYWSLAEDANSVIVNKLYKLLEYKKLDDYLSAEVGIQKRRFYYYSKVYHYFNNTLKGILADKPDLYASFLAEVKAMGWTKASAISTKKTITSDNAEEVIAQILGGDEKKALSVKKVEDLLDDVKSKLEEGELEEADGGEESVDRKQRLNFSFTRVQYNDVVKAMEHAGKIAGTGAEKATVLTSICRDYLGTHTIGDDDKVLATILSNYERLSGMVIVASDPNTGEIVYGNVGQDQEGES